MTKRMVERHELADISRDLDRLLHPFRIEERAFHQVLQNLNVPFRLVLGCHDLTVQQECLERFIVHLQTLFDLSLLDLFLPSTNGVFDRIGPNDSQSVVENADTRM